MSGITFGNITLSIDSTGSYRAPQTTFTGGNVYVSSTDPKVGNGSAYFGANGSIYLDNANLMVNATTERTHEFWVKDSGAIPRFYISMGNVSINSPTSSWWQIYSQAGNKLEIGIPGSALAVTAANTWYNNGTWQHFAWTTNGNNNSWYINGNLVLTFTRTSTQWSTTDNVLNLGGRANINLSVVNNMDAIRISSNVRYTANFTPTTVPYTNDANTVLLLQCDGANGTLTFPDDNYASTLTGVTISL